MMALFYLLCATWLPIFKILCSAEPLPYHQYEEGIPPPDCIANRQIALENYTTVEQFEKCAPFLLTDYARRYYLGAAGLRFSFRDNFRAYKRLNIIPKILRDVSMLDMTTTVLNKRVSFPVGADPVALQGFASPLAEIDTVRAAAAAQTIFILSVSASTRLEDVAAVAPEATKWMQTYIFRERNYTRDIVRRAEAAGFEAIVVTVDSPISGPVALKAEDIARMNPEGIMQANIPNDLPLDNTLTFKDITWLKSFAKIPIVAKGVLTADDAMRVALAGASAILVSNHGGRQLDFDKASIDALSDIVDALKNPFPHVEVYVDGGIRNGYDVFKALAKGARMVFVGRPIVWGLTVGGQAGFEKILNILRTQLNETMQLAGTPNLHSITRNMVASRNFKNSEEQIIGGGYEDVILPYDFYK